MTDEIYLYHYYPLFDPGMLSNIENIENMTISSLINMFGKCREPFKSLYRATLPLTENKIWLSQAAMLNDPFEFDIIYSPEYFGLAYEFYKMKQINPVSRERWMESILFEAKSFNGVIPRQILDGKTYGIFCLSKSPQNMLMWSHYANSHKGICVKFQNSQEIIGYYKKQ